MNNQNFWAFLVGIDEYASPGVPTLHGCRNDIRAMRDFLANMLGVPDRQIRSLENQEATRQRILDEFHTFLIDNDEIAPGSQILFHYSGHGSQMQNTTGTEPDGRDETLVPHDSRIGKVFDIPDKTLAALIQRLAEKRGQNITVILDCCHSGSGTRDARTNQAAITRRAPFDDRRPPIDLDAAYRVGATTRSGGHSGWAATGPNHVLLAGCLDREESHEHWTGTEDLQQGALTFFLLRCLREIPPGATYANLSDTVRIEVNTRYPNQTPQCEGQRERQVFGGALAERSSFIPVRSADGSELKLEAGVVHGMNVGAEIAIFPPTVTSRDNLPPPLATGHIIAVSATEASVALDSPPSLPLPLAARALVTREAVTNALLRVLLAETDAISSSALSAVRAAIQNARGHGRPSPYLEIVEEYSQPFDVRVVAESGQFSIRDPQDKQLVLPQDLGDQAAKSICTALESIARFRILVDMQNKDKSELVGKFALRLRRYEADKKPGELPLVASAGDNTLSLEYDPEFKERNQYVVEVVNNSAKDVFAHVFILNPDYSILRLYPLQGQNETLNASASLFCTPDTGGDYLYIYLPGDKPSEERWDLSHDQIKLFVTTKPCNLQSLVQEALAVPIQRSTRASSTLLEQLLNTCAEGGTTRLSRPMSTNVGEDWATASLSYTVQRKPAIILLDAAKASVEIGDGLILEKPQGFEGKISVAPLEQSRRGMTDEAPLKFPPGFERLSETFAPVTGSATRGFGGEPLVLTLEADEASRLSISPDNPLRIKLSETAEDYLPVAFDGEDYLPVGFGSDVGTVDIVRLPRAAAGGGGQPTTRGVGRAIRLFLFKKLGRISRDLGLRAVELSDTGYRYTSIDQLRFQPGDRVALMVHGFLSDTVWLARDVARILRCEVLPYEHILTWDYETFGTSVEHNGAELAAALSQQCGFGRDDGLTLHVYAHSMGTLVSRCLVEYAGGHDFVDRMVLAGPPNRGTTLASMSRGMTYLIAALLNGVGELPIAGAASWALKQLYEQGHGWEDLETDSELTRHINGLQAPNNVPYLVLAGDNTRNQRQGARLARLAHKLLDKGLDSVLGEQENDAVVPMSSMLGLRNGSYPLLESHVLPCDHFTYFALPESRIAIRDWVLRN